MTVHVVVRERVTPHHKGINRQYEILLVTASEARATTFRDELLRTLPGWGVYIVSRELDQ